MTMRCLGLAVAVLAVAYAAEDSDGEKASCQRLDEARSKGSLNYSTQPSEENYPDGTTVTLTCTNGPAVGQSTSKCDDGTWTPVLGYCGSNCSQKSAIELGYSGIYINGSTTENEAPHHSHVELLCGTERHKYRCHNGTFLAMYYTFQPCGACTAENVTRLGYTGMSVHGRTINGYIAEGTNVALQCRDETHWFTCSSGELQPYEKSESSCGCAPPNNATADDEVYIFSTSPKDGIYESGTEVTLYCMNGSVVSGTSESVCAGGGWYPPLGRCPKKCDAADLNEIKLGNITCRQATDSNADAGINQLQYHGGKASATCTADSKSDTYDVTCFDGVWWLHWFKTVETL